VSAAGAGRFGRGRLARGIVYNLVGVAVPAALGLLTVPLLVRGLGTERVGILTLGWSVLGYLALLHLGVGPALTQAAARGGERGDLDRLAWTGVTMTLLAGTLAAAGLLAAAPLLARTLRIPPALHAEAVLSFRILALALPFTVGSPALAGLLEAHGWFGRSNVVGSAISAASYLGPLAALAAGASLPGVLAVLAAARALGWLAYLALCLRGIPVLRGRVRPARAHAGELLRFGGWTTVSAVVSPLMVYMDRFVVGALAGPAAVAWYGTPQEAMLRMGMVSGAVAGVLFPAFAAAGGTGREQLGPLLKRGADAVFVLMFPLSLLLASFAREGLHAWLGPEFAQQGGAALAWLGAGLLANGLAKPAAAMVLGLGRPDLTARLHLLELPLYVGALYLLVSAMGLRGAAIAWVARAAVDAAALYWTATRLEPGTAPAARRAALLGVAGGAALAVGAWLDGVLPRLLWMAAAAVPVAILAARRTMPELRAAARALRRAPAER
jgi:O-antigen/teichoic acid export membrane protein